MVSRLSSFLLPSCSRALMWLASSARLMDSISERA